MQNRPTILVIDDSNQFLFMMKSMLEFNRLNVNAMADSLESKAIIESKTYDLIIIDYIMDKMDGLQLAEFIRQTEKNKRTKVILLTTKGLDEFELETVNRLQLKYIQKPIVPADLVKKILVMVGERL